MMNFQKASIFAVEKLLMTTPAKPRTTTRNQQPTKSQLEATIRELKAALKEAQEKEVQQKEPQHHDENFDELKHALEEAHRKEGALQQKVTDLQSELQHHKKLVHKLQTEIEKLEQIKSDFEQAKKAALQLAEVNEKLMQEIKTLTKEKEKEKEVIPTKMNISVESMPPRPIQKESEKQVDFATKSWLL